VPGTTVTVTDSNRVAHSAITDQGGHYSISGLPAGTSSIAAVAPNMALAEPISSELKPGVQTLNLQLHVQTIPEKLNVEEEAAPSISTDSANNASATVLTGNDLAALADDPDDLAQDLQALAGPSAGPNGGALYVDGFSGGTIPPKESIREIRINQNPFSPEYDKLGYGRIEIFTKPGTDKLRGTAFFNLGDSVWNSRDPYAEQKAPFLLREYGGNIGGPIGKPASFMLNVEGAAIDNGAIIHAITLDPQSLAILNPFTDVFSVPQRRIIVTPRLDYQLNSSNTLTLRYRIEHATIADQGVGSLNLVSVSNRVHSLNHTFQATETAVLGNAVVNETRFQFYRVGTSTLPNTIAPETQVLGAFNGGGSQSGPTDDQQNNYEMQNYTTATTGNHTIRFGLRVRVGDESMSSRQNFGGTFTFSGGIGPELNAVGQPILDSSGNPILVNLQSIERYQRTFMLQQLGYSPAQIQALGGGPSQFTINAGDPLVSATQTDVGAFVGDDWKLRPTVTLATGLRYEGQTNIHDWRDFGPRIGVSWQPGAQSKFVVRAGFGIFYDRFALANVLTALRYNGVVQQQFVIQNPDFYPDIPPLASLATPGVPQTIEQVSRFLRAPYLMQSGLSLERQLTHGTTLALTYANTHGLHQLRTEDINAPLPGTFNPSVSGSGVFPLGNPGAVFVMKSDGLYNQNQLIANVNSRVNTQLSFFARYTFNRALSNTDGLSTTPANPYNFAGEYGPSSSDVRHSVNLGGSFERWKFRISPLITIRSGPPFDITVGRDLFGDTLFNARPGIALDKTRPGLVPTSYGLLDPNPIPGERILSRNFGRGPGFVMINTRLTKVFEFGRQDSRGKGGAQSAGNGTEKHGRYSLSISASFRNILNHNNPGSIVGDITSPFFGRANQSAGATSLGGTGFLESANNRRLEFQTRFTF
jgi:hypothetical protein